MTLKEMHRRLGEIIEDHNRCGWSERNDQQVIVRAQRPDRKRRCYMVIGIDYACGGSLNLGDGEWLTELKGTVKRF